MIFKKDSKGNIRTWDSEIDGHRYRITTGILGGKVTTSDWTVAQPKNVGRTNETTAEQQAVIEVDAKRKKKLALDYHKTIDTVDIDKVFKPMLATKFEDRLRHLQPTNHLLAQPKLDGVRMIATSKGLFTRTGKSLNTVAHIAEALSPIFEAHPDLILDGELYNHDLKDDFQTIVSLVKREKISAKQQAETQSLVQYHLYDVAQGTTGSYEERHAFLTNIVDLTSTTNILHVVGYDIVSKQSDLMVRSDGKLVLGPVADHYLSLGYEGTMVRINETPYQRNKRSASLMKLKLFDDDEFELLGFKEGNGNWSGTAKMATIRRNDGSTGVATMRGSVESLRKILADPAPFIGKMATVRYFGLTDDNQLRHPVVQTIHETDRI